MSWDAAFDEPVELPNGKTARTLRNAGEYIAKLPKAEHEQKAWQTAMHCLIEAAEGRGFIRFARMGMLQAIHREEEDHFGPGKRVAKEPHLGSQKVGEGPMSSNAETLARVILEIDRILGEYLEPMSAQMPSLPSNKSCSRWTATMRSERPNAYWMGISGRRW